MPVADPQHHLVDIGDLVTADQLRATVDAVAEWQLPSGMVPWYPGGHADPWNHTEALMALMLGGHRAAAERGFDWLQSLQRPDVVAARRGLAAEDFVPKGVLNSYNERQKARAAGESH